ncbi:hypothetical protein AB3S75_036801 [Citrus x aurantiifolia]
MSLSADIVTLAAACGIPDPRPFGKASAWFCDNGEMVNKKKLEFLVSESRHPMTCYSFLTIGSLLFLRTKPDS